MKIVIIGAGLGGLTAAFRLAKSGHHVDVLERAPALKTGGGGISIRASATKYMQSWGLGDDLDDISDRSATTTYRDLKTAKVLNVVAVPAGQRDWGATRKAMLTLLSRRAIEAGARLLFDAAAVDVSEDDTRATVALADGRELSADLVLAADGIKSHARRKVLADLGPWEQFEPVIDPETLYSFEESISLLTDDPSTRLISQTCDVTAWLGSTAEDGYVVARFSNKLQHVRLWCAVHEPGTTQGDALWEEVGDIHHVRRAFAGAFADLTELLQRSESCSRWKIAEMPNLPRWSSLKGRIALLGDSAHGMHPTAGQGYTTIIEEIAVLDYLFSLPRGGDSDGDGDGDTLDMSHTLRTWEAICKPRAEQIKAFSRWRTLGFSGRSSVDIATHATSFAKEGDAATEETLPTRDARFGTKAFHTWNYAYDSIEEAKAYLARHGAVQGSV